MRSVLIAALAIVPIGAAHAQVSALSPDQKKEFNEIAMTFVLADECSKRYGKTALFEKATEAYRKAAIKFDLPNGSAAVEQAADELRAKPLSTGGFTLVTPQSCEKLDGTLTSYLER